MTIDDVRTICVVGAGTMGSRIALHCAVQGFKVNQLDSIPEMIEKAKIWHQENINNRVPGSDAEKVLSRISYMPDMKMAAGASDFVIEAVPEKLDLKRKIFGELDKICPSHTILATNSSSIKSSLIAVATRRPDKVLNMHFALRVESNGLLEIMGSALTSKETIEMAMAVGHALEMATIYVKKEVIGFTYNRVWRAVKKAALGIVEMGSGTVEDVDRAWMAARPGEDGPFVRMDKIGLDVILDIEEQWYKESGDPRDKPPEFLIKKVREGKLGVKTGEGFYIYPHPAYERSGWLRSGSEKSARS